MSETNLIECKYGNHFCKPEDFTESGLNNKCYTICRNCVRVRRNKYRHKYQDKYNQSKREYNRQWIANKRAQNKQQDKQELSV